MLLSSYYELGGEKDRKKDRGEKDRAKYQTTFTGVANKCYLMRCFMKLQICVPSWTSQNWTPYSNKVELNGY